MHASASWSIASPAESATCPRRTTGILTLAALILVSSTGGSQELPGTCTPEPLPDVLVEKTAYLSIEPLPQVEDTEHGDETLNGLRLVLQAIQRSFEAPPQVGVSPSATDVLDGDRDESQPYTPTVVARLDFIAHADGRVSGIRIDEPSSAAGLDSAVVRAVRRAATEWSIGSLAIAAMYGTRPDRVDTTSFHLSVTTEPDSAVASFPIARLALAAYPVREALLTPGNRPPPYPGGLESRRVEGSVLLEFIVGTNGRVELESTRVLEETHPAFTLSVLLHLPRFRYRPAELGGCPARMSILQPFSFNIGR